MVRGICSLRPGIKNVSETISVHSIVGELLEHARIYYFGRIEVLTPVLDKKLMDNILKQIVNPQLADNTHAWELLSDGSYKKIKREAGVAAMDSQSHIKRVLNLLKR